MLFTLAKKRNKPATKAPQVPVSAEDPATAVVAGERGERRASVFLWMLKICGFTAASFYLPYWDNLIELGPRSEIFVRGYVIGYTLLFFYFLIEAGLYWRRINR